jgi:RimJ/RimL family protein N-acetyltransferase
MQVVTTPGKARKPDGRALVGRTVRLDPAQDADGEGLFDALDHDEVWAMGYAANRPRPKSAGAWRQAIEAALTEDRMMYVVRAIEPSNPRDGRIIGTSSLGDIDVDNEKCHLGWTAYTPSVWGTSVNPECKLLLLWHAFEHCGFGRVKIQTDSINVRSQAAIAKLGAVREGVVRRDFKRRDGTWRDSVVYSVLIDEWPAVKAGLERRLDELSGQSRGDVSRGQMTSRESK